jgi:CRISPR-associated protein Cas1
MLISDSSSPTERSQTHVPLIPVRMLNEYVYCPRLAYLMWVQGEFAHNEFTVDGVIRHRRVDSGGGVLPEQPGEDEKIHARSVSLSSERLGITAKMDLVEGEGMRVTPVDYKRSKRPHVAGGAYEPERVQLCAQGLLLREHGFDCADGVLYFAASRERVKIPLDDALVARTIEAIGELKARAAGKDVGAIPPPLEDSPKCPRCSLMGICLPDEVRFLAHLQEEPRPIFAADAAGLPLYVQSPRAWVRKDGERLIIEEDKVRVAEARLEEVSQVAIFGNTALTTAALHECLRRQIPITWLSYGGWFLGHTVGTGHRNVETRTHQYRRSFDPETCLQLARRWVVAKIANCRTMVRRNWRGEGDEGKAPPNLLRSMREDMRQAMRAESLDVLLGVEGAGAGRYFQHLSRLLRNGEDPTMRFDFKTRNRRPPRDPVNAMLSFAYSMLTREWTVTLSAVGLDPYRGFYHQPRFGRPALALDMMEPFRPIVADSTVLTAVNNGEVQPGDFVRTAGACNLTDSGRKRFIAAFERRMEHEVTHPVFGYKVSYRRLFEVQARLLIRYLAGEIPAYPNFVTR